MRIVSSLPVGRVCILCILCFLFTSFFTAGEASAQVYSLELNVFIAAPTVSVPWVTVGVGISPGSYDVGDNRTFNSSGTSRVSQGVLILSDSTDFKVLSFEGPTIGHSFLYDSNGNQESDGYADPSSISASAVQSSNVITVTFSGDPTNPTVPGAPGINYSFTVQFTRDPNGGPPSVAVLSANHDAFPSYEILGHWNGNPYSILYMFSETNVQSLEVNPFRVLSDGNPPTNYVIPNLPTLQNGGTIGATTFIDQWVNAVNAYNANNGQPSTTTTKVTIGQAQPVQYQDTEGNWQNWEN